MHSEQQHLFGHPRAYGNAARGVDRSAPAVARRWDDRSDPREASSRLPEGNDRFHYGTIPRDDRETRAANGDRAVNGPEIITMGKKERVIYWLYEPLEIAPFDRRRFLFADRSFFNLATLFRVKSSPNPHGMNKDKNEETLIRH